MNLLKKVTVCAEIVVKICSSKLGTSSCCLESCNSCHGRPKNHFFHWMSRSSHLQISMNMTSMIYLLGGKRSLLKITTAHKLFIRFQTMEIENFHGKEISFFCLRFHVGPKAWTRQSHDINQNKKRKKYRILISFFHHFS